MTTTAVYEPIETRRGLPPDPEDMNAARAQAAAGALERFMITFGERPSSADADEVRDMARQNLTDLIADFGHFCDRHVLKLAECIDSARDHYIE